MAESQEWQEGKRIEAKITGIKTKIFPLGNW